MTSAFSWKLNQLNGTFSRKNELSVINKEDKKITLMLKAFSEEDILTISRNRQQRDQICRELKELHRESQATGN